MRCDELWVFGTPTDGVEVEISWAREHGLPIQRFALDHYGEAIRAQDE